MDENALSGPALLRDAGANSHPRSGLALRAVDWWLRSRGVGGLKLSLPSGRSAKVGIPATAVEPSLDVRSWRALWSIARRGALGFAESYMHGHIDTDDLRAVFDLYYANENAISRALPRFNDTRRRDRRFHFHRANTRTGSRRNIADHYDLGNAFYRLWLDDSMFYSSGIYTDEAATLEQAQSTKLARILASLELADGARLLEIGCGWGALAEASARQGAHVRAITLSEQQLLATRDRVASAGLSAPVDVALEDYRDTAGTFDRLVSIEMIEAVGEDNWPLFFNTINDRLRPDGLAVIQAITIREDAFEQYRANPDFIQRYIFPGGMLPTVPLMQERAADAGLSFETIERFGTSYALTLADWRRRFERAWPQIEALGFDERFRRMWRFYLTYCEVGFERGLIDVGLYRLRKQL